MKLKNGQSNTGAFTLVELIIAMTILAILAGMAVPAVTGIQKERVAREPINQLLLMARKARTRAMAEQRPYQVAFDSTGFRAARFFNPYGGSEEFDQLQLELQELERRDEMIEASMARGITLNDQEKNVKLEALADGMRFQEVYEIDPNLQYRIRMWGDTDWQDMSSGVFRRWVFQPSGMCEPLRIQIENDTSFFEVEFHPLTGDIRRERSWVE